MFWPKDFVNQIYGNMEKSLRISLSKMTIGAKSVKEYVVLINGNKHEEITVFFINFATKETIEFCEFNNSKKLIDEIPDLFQQKNIKAVILNVFEVVSTDYKNNVEFCKALKAKFSFFCIPFCFLSSFNYFLNKKIIAANIVEINDGESLLMIEICGNEKFGVNELIFTNNGYEYSDLSMLEVENDELTKLFCDIFVAEIKPIKIILISEIPGSTLMKKMKEIYFQSESEKLIILEHSINKFKADCCIEVAKWIFDKNHTKFLSINKTSRKFCIGNIYGPEKKKIILSTDKNMPLPFRKSITVPSSVFEYFFGYFEPNINDYIILEEFKLEPDSHEYKIDLKIDENHFPSFKMYGFMLPEITELIDKLNANLQSKIPVITFFYNSSVICANKNGGYEFLQLWNGKFGEQLFVSFDEEKPKFCESAIKVYETKPTTVVFDILKILSNDGICFDKSWGFIVRKYKSGRIFIEFDNFDGNRRKSEANFLLSLLIQEQIKAIEKEIGHRPSEICFNILYSKGKEIIMKNVEEACKPLNIDCSFVDFD